MFVQTRVCVCETRLCVGGGGEQVTMHVATFSVEQRALGSLFAVWAGREVGCWVGGWVDQWTMVAGDPLPMWFSSSVLACNEPLVPL